MAGVLQRQGSVAEIMGKAVFPGLSRVLTRMRADYRDRLDTGRGRALAWLDSMVFDHGFLRLVIYRRRPVTRGIYRSDQPNPWHLRAAARDGIRSVLNLRGERDCGSFHLERWACARQGLAFESVVLRSRGVPELASIAAFRAAMARLPEPILLHCKAGADRAGLASALILLDRGAPPEEAARHLSLAYGHVRSGPTGVLDAFVDLYRQAWAARRVPFRTWLETEYDPVALKASFRPQPLGTLLTDWVLRRE